MMRGQSRFCNVQHFVARVTPDPIVPGFLPMPPLPNPLFHPPPPSLPPSHQASISFAQAAATAPPAPPLSPRATPGASSSGSSSPHSHAPSSAAPTPFAPAPLPRAPQGGRAGGYTGSRPVGDASHLTAGEAAELLLDCVYEFNACVPYSGLTHDAEIDPQALAALLAVLPEGIQVGWEGGRGGQEGNVLGSDA